MRAPTNNALKPLAALTAIAAVGVIVLGPVLLRDRGEPAVEVPANAPSTRSTPLRVASADARSEPLAIVKLRELRAMSETYRNTTFLIAIRDAGFVCHELLGVYGGVDTSATWTATCRDTLAYTVRVADSGALAVEPFGQYWDGVGPAPVNPQTTRPQLLPEPLR